MKPYKIVIVVVVAVIALGGAGAMVGIRFFNTATGPIFGAGTEVPMEMTLVYQNGHWLVTGLSVLGGLQTGGGSNQPKN